MGRFICLFIYNRCVGKQSALKNTSAVIALFWLLVFILSGRFVELAVVLQGFILSGLCLAAGQLKTWSCEHSARE